MLSLGVHCICKAEVKEKIVWLHLIVIYIVLMQKRKLLDRSEGIDKGIGSGIRKIFQYCNKAIVMPQVVLEN